MIYLVEFWLTEDKKERKIKENIRSTQANVRVFRVVFFVHRNKCIFQIIRIATEFSALYFVEMEITCD